MICCEPTIQPFTNQSSTTIVWDSNKQDLYGSRPNVQVYYKEGTEYVLSDDMNSVVFDGSTIFVDHGGLNTGIIKIF
jgi:hypothetical protein